MHMCTRFPSLAGMVLMLAWDVRADAASGDKIISLPLWSVFDGKGAATNITIGSNHDTVPVLIYTSARDVWINPTCPDPSIENFTALGLPVCQSNTLYDPKKSKTAKPFQKPKVKGNDTYTDTEYDDLVIAETGYIPYYDNTSDIFSGHGWGYLAGQRFEDVVGIGDARIRQQFSISYNPRNMDYGMFSLMSWNDEYPIDVLVKEDRISSRAFGFQVPVGKKQGSLIFGGFDKKKYECTLVSRPLYTTTNKADVQGEDYSPGGAKPKLFKTLLAGITQTLPSNINETYNYTLFPSPGLNITLSSELFYTILPGPLFHAIGTSYPNATFSASTSPHNKSLYTAPCTIPPSGSLNLLFGPNKTISIPYSDFLYSAGNNTCYLKMAMGMHNEETGEEGAQLGASFFRAAYLVFDIENKEVWMDQSDDCGEELAAIGKGVGKVHLEVRTSPGGCRCAPGGEVPGVMPPKASGTGSAGAKPSGVDNAASMGVGKIAVWEVLLVALVTILGAMDM